MALGHNMKRKTLIPTSIEELIQHQDVREEVVTVFPENNIVESASELTTQSDVNVVEIVEQITIEETSLADNNDVVFEERIVEAKPVEPASSVSNNKAFTESNDEVLIEFKPSLRTKVNKINVYISGKLNIYNANFIKQNIMQHCAKYGTVEIIAKGVEELDLTFIQFGYYYSKNKQSLGQLVTFDIDKPSVQVLNLLDLNGFTDLLIRKKLA